MAQFKRLRRVVSNALRKDNSPREVSLQLCLEHPFAGSRVGDQVVVKGWVFSRAGSPRGSIYVNHQHGAELRFHDARDDIQASVSDISPKWVLEFEQKVDICPYKRSGEGILLSLAVENASQSQMIGPVVVFPAVFPESRHQGLSLSLENPAAGSEYVERVLFRGWVLSPEGAAPPVRIRLGSDICAEITAQIPRPDMNELHRLSPPCFAFGFEKKLSWNELGFSGDLADFWVETAQGDSIVSVGPVRIKRSAVKLPVHERGNYKVVWDEAARDQVSAMLAVSGTGEFEEFMASGRSTATTVRNTISIGEIDVVLEIGCGTGRIGRALAPACKRWIGADVSKKMLAFARENLKDLPNVELIELDGAGLSAIEDNSLDKLYCSVVFMHLEEWDRYRYVKEAQRVLKPGGSCYFDNLNLAGEEGWKVFSQLASLDPAQRLPQISKTSTAEELVCYLKYSGFVEIKTRLEPLLVTVWGVKP